jgi:hypothetical protein
MKEIGKRTAVASIKIQSRHSSGGAEENRRNSVMTTGALADIQATFLLNSSHRIMYRELRTGRGRLECNDPAVVKIG